jgi:phage gpG-like protein
VSFVSYKIENDKSFQKKIDRAFEESLDLRIPFKLISRDFYRSQKAIFSLKGAGGYPDFKGEVYKDGMTKYQFYKKKRFGFDYPLLKATGALEESTTKPDSGDSILEIEKDFLRIGTTLPYANFHQQDNPNLGNRKIPTRKYLFIGPEARNANSDQRGRLDRWIKIIDNYMTVTLKKDFE